MTVLITLLLFADPGSETGSRDLHGWRVVQTSSSLPPLSTTEDPDTTYKDGRRRADLLGPKGRHGMGLLVFFLCHYPRLGAEGASNLETSMGTTQNTPTDAALSDKGPGEDPPSGLKVT